MTKTGKLIITFDDGLSSHYAAGELLAKHGLMAVFGVVTGRVGTPDGKRPVFLTWEELECLTTMDHLVVNHSHQHFWSGYGAPKAGKKSYDRSATTSDYLQGKAELDGRNVKGMRGDYLIVPYGTSNVIGNEHLLELANHFSWIRLTTGYPVENPSTLWKMEGGKRLYRHDYIGHVFGASATADARRPGGIIDCVNVASLIGSTAVLRYHSVADVAGSQRNITWEQFERDVLHMSELVEQGRLENVLP